MNFSFFIHRYYNAHKFKGQWIFYFIFIDFGYIIQLKNSTFHIMVSPLFSNPLISPVSSALSFPYTFPHILVVSYLLFVSGNFDVACPFFPLFFFLLPQVFIFLHLWYSHKVVCLPYVFYFPLLTWKSIRFFLIYLLHTIRSWYS